MDRVSSFAEFMISIYSYFVRAYSFEDDDFNADALVFLDVSKRYFKDVERLHKYHDITRIDAYKIAGYTTYWISKLKPIGVANASLYGEHSEFCLYINKIFSIYVATGRMLSMDNVKRIRLDQELLASFLYLLKYRATSGDNLSMMFRLLGV